MTMTTDELDRLAALCEAATPGPWLSPYLDDGEIPMLGLWPTVAEYLKDPADTKFVCAARAAVPALIAEVRRLLAELKEAKVLGHGRCRDCENWGGVIFPGTPKVDLDVFAAAGKKPCGVVAGYVRGEYFCGDFTMSAAAKNAMEKP